MKRLAIYVHHDPKGEVRDYILYCLKGLQEVIDDILFVVNGCITPEGRKHVEDLGVKVLVRENKGFDWWAWKAGLEFLGYDKIAEYDELLLTNNTYYGPIYPFSEMWSEMDKRDCDFWGIAQHPKTDMLWVKGDPQSVMLRHIQSYWLVFKKRVFTSEDFQRYWMNLVMHNSFNEMVGYGETKLTDYFYKHGYSYDTYITFKECSKYGDTNPCLFTAKHVIENRCPIIKRKYFYDTDFQNFDFYNSSTLGPRTLLDFLNKEKIYDTGLIWNDLLSIAPMSEIADRLSLNYILPATSYISSLKPCKAVVIMYIHPMELVEYCFSYAKNIPTNIDIVIVNTSLEVQLACRKAFEKLPNKIEYRLQQNRGRDNTALLVTCNDIIKQYEFLCFVHAKQSPYFQFLCNGEYFRENNFASLLYSETYIENILSILQNNDFCGLLIPFIPSSSSYKNLLDDKWGPNWENAQNVLSKKFKTDIKPDKDVMGPWGNMFWCRTSALKTLTSYAWSFDDFPKEPLHKSDGLLTHSIERLISTLVQKSGYYTAFISPIPLAQNIISNIYYGYRNKKVQINNATTIVGPKDFYNYKKDKLRYYRYKILSKITFGKMREHYKIKRKELKAHLKEVRKFLKNS